jgi:hypothetical protein
MACRIFHRIYSIILKFNSFDLAPTFSIISMILFGLLAVNSCSDNVKIDRTWIEAIPELRPFLLPDFIFKGGSHELDINVIKFNIQTNDGNRGMQSILQVAKNQGWDISDSSESQFSFTKSINSNVETKSLIVKRIGSEQISFIAK